MPAAYPLPKGISPATVANTAFLLRIVALALISGAAIASRLFAVINFESIIHELYARLLNWSTGCRTYVSFQRSMV